ncbi:aquaporin TIP4-4-like [Musa acuminata AAA Group]|uniref:aquaporin TIP4-4-like n=1 Tax=Musa acuminata AAA Group TaxID=214697 RepID=UPI0031CF3B61
MRKITLGSRNEAVEPDFVRSVLTELLLTFLFVFAGVGAAMTAEEVAGGEDRIMWVVAAPAAAHAMLVAVITAVGLDVSAGHLNPAVTIGFATGGYVTVVRCVLYVIAQLLGSSMACLLLKYVAAGLDVLPVHALAAGMDPLQGVIMEAVFTFSMVFAVYALIMDPKKGAIAGSAPLLIGLTVGANSLAGGAFSGASMNPARSFGPALANWDWTNHWVYWLGPLVGSGLAGFAHHHLYVAGTHGVLLPKDDEVGF